MFQEDGSIALTPIKSSEKKTIEKLNLIKIELDSISKKCRHLVGSFRHSESLQKQLKVKQTELKYESKTKLIQDVPTRWNTKFDQLDSISNNKDALNSLAILPQNKSIKDFVPNEQEYILINDYCDLLFPLKNSTVMMSGQKYCTVSILFPAIYKLVNFELNDIELSTKQCIKLRESLLSSLVSRFQYLFEDDTFIASTFLDFRMNKFDFLNDEIKAQIFIKRAKSRIIQFYNS